MTKPTSKYTNIYQAPVSPALREELRIQKNNKEETKSPDAQIGRNRQEESSYLIFFK